jgi:hypothetical protein
MVKTKNQVTPPKDVTTKKNSESSSDSSSEVSSQDQSDMVSVESKDIMELSELYFVLSKIFGDTKENVFTVLTGIKNELSTLNALLSKQKE